MTGNKKIITINPDFLKINKKGKSRNRTRSNHNRTQKLDRIKQYNLKPNNIKKSLLKKIKQYQQKKKEEYSNDDTKEEFIDTTIDFSSAMKSLDAIIKQKKRDKTIKKRQRRNKHKKLQFNTNTQIQQPNNLNSHPKIHLNNLESQSGGTNAAQSPPPQLVTQQTINNIPFKSSLRKEPPYGCLKGGKKLTYRQYQKSLKNNHKQTPNTPKINILNATNTITHKTKDMGENIEIRKKKMEEYKKKYLLKNANHNKKYKKKFKIHTMKKIYNLGKKGDNVYVLINNNKTRKKIKKAVDALDKVPMLEIKKYLKKKHLLKTGSNAPETVLREMFKNARLAGEITNKSSNILVHNYFEQ